MTKLTLLKYWPWKTSSAAQSSAMALKQPVGQKRLTNVAVVRALAGGKGEGSQWETCAEVVLYSLLSVGVVNTLSKSTVLQ